MEVGGKSVQIPVPITPVPEYNKYAPSKEEKTENEVYKLRTELHTANRKITKLSEVIYTMAQLIGIEL